jgi:hypothetical protein
MFKVGLGLIVVEPFPAMGERLAEAQNSDNSEW